VSSSRGWYGASESEAYLRDSERMKGLRFAMESTPHIRRARGHGGQCGKGKGRVGRKKSGKACLGQIAARQNVLRCGKYIRTLNYVGRNSFEMLGRGPVDRRRLTDGTCRVSNIQDWSKGLSLAALMLAKCQGLLYIYNWWPCDSHLQP
jgi:hypothetical protein